MPPGRIPTPRGAGRPPLRAWTRPLRAALAASAAALAIAGGCGGRPRVAGAGVPGRGGAGVTVACAARTRARGIPDFPGPTGHGPVTRSPGADGRPVVDGVPLAETGQQLQAAQQACRPYLAAGPGAGQPSAQERQAADAYAACMRGHGVPDFPHPTLDHGTTFDTPSGFDPRSAQAQGACGSLLPGSGAAGGPGGRSGSG